MSVDEFRKKLEERAKANRAVFEGLYKDEIEGLLGLSREEIDELTPDTTDKATYDSLISVVKEASAANISKAELKDRITGLGSVAINIAGRVPGLSALFG